MTYNNYFKLRNINENFYKNYKVPNYILKIIKDNNIKKILDFGCGIGQLVKALKEKNIDIVGMDNSDQAIQIGKKNGIDIIKVNNLDEEKENYKNKFDLIIISHVLEHQKKNEMKVFLSNLKYMLKNEKYLLTIVPNAQSLTGVYWRYEDFTHEFLFTSGSLFYLLSENGFENIKFLDIYATSKLNYPLKIIRYLVIRIYELFHQMFLKITGNSYHSGSKNIFTYEIKCLSKKIK
tara:strand:+ start:177 stop:881 length:705 start_codon:yes stop_codon:yes gene_type:complete